MEQQRKVLYRGFGTQKPGGMLANMFDIRDKVSLVDELRLRWYASHSFYCRCTVQLCCCVQPVANTALIEWAGKLWALWEASRPFTLDPDTLETLGEDDLGAPLPPASRTHEAPLSQEPIRSCTYRGS